jgi:hypothetical protein
MKANEVYIKIVEHTVLEINPKRECFTCYGLHLNELGGESISKQIAVQISIILGEKVADPVSLGWESELKEGAATQLLENRNEIGSNKENENKQVAMSDSEVLFPRVSNRQKKALVTGKDDFLW